MEIKAESDDTQCGVRTVQSDLWDNVSGFTGCTTSLRAKHVVYKPVPLFFPNPTKGIVHIDLPNEIKEFEVYIYNSFGQKMYYSQNAIRIDLPNHRNGIFYIEIITKEKIFGGKIVKIE